MLRLRFLSDARPRAKNGWPHHSATGVARTSWTQLDAWGAIHLWRPARWPPISRAKTGAASARPIQNRRVMSASSGLGPLSAEASSGSSAMPQIGQLPGPTCRTCGCIGQV